MSTKAEPSTQAQILLCENLKAFELARIARANSMTRNEKAILQFQNLISHFHTFPMFFMFARVFLWMFMGKI